MKRCSTTGKDRYPSKLEADIAMSRSIERAKKHAKQRNRELPRRTYKCEFCRGWHLTSQEQRSENESSRTVGS